MGRDDNVPCPYCGAPIKKNASSCPECGSDERTGWSEGQYLDGIDLPDESDYEELVAKEFGSQKQKEKNRPNWHSIAGIVVVVLFLVLLLRPVC
ncbi:MAG: zinc-ribbon domain-containing protein [Chitinivibrionales bacterium]